MQILINIPEQKYKWIVENPLVYTTEIDEAVRKGKALPKGHGELYDKKDLLKTLHTDSWVWMYGILESVSPVIEADKESK